MLKPTPRVGFLYDKKRRKVTSHRGYDLTAQWRSFTDLRTSQTKENVQIFQPVKGVFA